MLYEMIITQLKEGLFNSKLSHSITIATTITITITITRINVMFTIRTNEYLALSSDWDLCLRTPGLTRCLLNIYGS